MKSTILSHIERYGMFYYITNLTGVAKQIRQYVHTFMSSSWRDFLFGILGRMKAHDMNL